VLCLKNKKKGLPPYVFVGQTQERTEQNDKRFVGNRQTLRAFKNKITLRLFCWLFRTFFLSFFLSFFRSFLSCFSSKEKENVKT